MLSLLSDRCMPGGLQGFFGQTNHPFRSPEVLKLEVPISVYSGCWQNTDLPKMKRFFSLNGPFFSCHLMAASYESSPQLGGRAFHGDFTHFTPFLLKRGASCACTSTDNKFLSCQDCEAGKFHVLLMCGGKELRKPHPVDYS